MLAAASRLGAWNRKPAKSHQKNAWEKETRRHCIASGHLFLSGLGLELCFYVSTVLISE